MASAFARKVPGKGGACPGPDARFLGREGEERSLESGGPAYESIWGGFRGDAPPNFFPPRSEKSGGDRRGSTGESSVPRQHSTGRRDAADSARDRSAHEQRRPPAPSHKRESPFTLRGKWLDRGLRGSGAPTRFDRPRTTMRMVRFAPEDPLVEQHGPRRSWRQMPRAPASTRSSDEGRRGHEGKERRAAQVRRPAGRHRRVVHRSRFETLAVYRVDGHAVSTSKWVRNHPVRHSEPGQALPAVPPVDDDGGHTSAEGPRARVSGCGIRWAGRCRRDKAGRPARSSRRAAQGG